MSVGPRIFLMRPIKNSLTSFISPTNHSETELREASANGGRDLLVLESFQGATDQIVKHIEDHKKRIREQDKI